MAVVYQHRRLDNNEIFYIGVEYDTNNKKAIGKRSKKRHGRSNFWKKIISKTDYSIQILYDDLTNNEAKQIEIYLIAYYGRRDLGLGNLVNLTDGGEGTLGYTHSEETREKIRKKSLGRIVSKETRDKISISGKNRIVKDSVKLLISERMKNNKLWLNRSHSEETKLKMSNSAKGLKSKKVICIETDKIWNSVGECAKENNINYSTLTKRLNGQTKKLFNLRYL